MKKTLKFISLFFAILLGIAAVMIVVAIGWMVSPLPMFLYRNFNSSDPFHWLFLGCGIFFGGLFCGATAQHWSERIR